MKPLVSIRCVCYNHEKYLRQALDSVLHQKTSFPYEVLIHDDASTDGSQEIIREYMGRYPNLIKAILQTENQYSQGKKIADLFDEMTHGDYVVLLECDDFWQDEYKLQKQVDALNAHPECVMCVHRTELYDEQGLSMGRFDPQEQLSEGVLYQDGLVEYLANVSQFHTTSRMIRMNIYKNLSQAPYYTNRKKVGDLPMVLYLSQQGPFYYIADAMTGYRMNSTESYTRRMMEDIKYFCEERTELRKMWLSFGRCHPQYQELSLQQADYFGISEVKARLSIGSVDEYHLVHSEPYFQYYQKLSFFEKAKGWMRIYFPIVIPVYKFFKSMVKHE